MSDPSVFLRWSLIAVILYLILRRAPVFANAITALGGVVNDAVRVVQGRA